VLHAIGGGAPQKDDRWVSGWVVEGLVPDDLALPATGTGLGS